MGSFSCQNCGQGCCTCSGCQQVTFSDGKLGCSRCQASYEANKNAMVAASQAAPHVGIKIQSITYTHNHTG